MNDESLFEKSPLLKLILSGAVFFAMLWAFGAVSVGSDSVSAPYKEWRPE